MTKILMSFLLATIGPIVAQAQTVVVHGSKIASVASYDYGPPMSGSVRSRELTVMSSGDVVEVDKYIHFPNGVIDSFEAMCVVSKVSAETVDLLKAEFAKIDPDDQLETEAQGADGGAVVFGRYYIDRSARETRHQPVARTRFSGGGFLLLTEAKDAASAMQKILSPILAGTKPCPR